MLCLSSTAIANTLRSSATALASPSTTTTITNTATTIISSSPSLAAAAGYMLSANMIYLARRSHLRSMKKRDLLRIRTTREAGVSWPLFFIFILAWQSFVFVFPLVEITARAFGRVSFFYDYPNAQGFGFISEPLSVQHLKMSKRSKEQIRFDWHRFSVNVGAIGRDGYRHPPAVERNLPHLDIPRLAIKHWPWRRKRSIERTTAAKRRKKISQQ